MKEYTTRLKSSLRGRQCVSTLNRFRGQFVTVSFVKRSTGAHRTLTCIFSPKYLTGRWAFSLPEKGLLPVYDVRAGHVKCIPVDGIRLIRAGGTYHVENGTRQVTASAWAPGRTVVDAIRAPRRRKLIGQPVERPTSAGRSGWQVNPGDRVALGSNDCVLGTARSVFKQTVCGTFLARVQWDGETGTRLEMAGDLITVEPTAAEMQQQLAELF